MKTFHAGFFQEHGLNTEWQEHYTSHSVPGVVRGMHFQLPPHDHEKLVFCVAGRVLDVLLDLRVASPTYGKTCSLELSDQDVSLIYIPKGIAHGFFAPEAATLSYSVSTQHAHHHDAGVHFRSATAPWPEDPIVSERDLALPSLESFQSPFVYDPDSQKIYEP